MTCFLSLRPGCCWVVSKVASLQLFTGNCFSKSFDLSNFFCHSFTFCKKPKPPQQRHQNTSRRQIQLIVLDEQAASAGLLYWTVSHVFVFQRGGKGHYLTTVSMMKMICCHKILTQFSFEYTAKKCGFAKPV